jgi:hypothetical protein
VDCSFGVFGMVPLILVATGHVNWNSCGEGHFQASPRALGAPASRGEFVHRPRCAVTLHRPPPLPRSPPRSPTKNAALAPVRFALARRTASLGQLCACARKTEHGTLCTCSGQPKLSR